MHVTITSVAGACFPIDLGPDATVAEAKLCLQQQHGFTFDTATLYVGEKKLSDETNLMDLSVDDRSAITVIFNELEPIVLRVPILIDDRQGDDWRLLAKSEKLKHIVTHIFINADTFQDQEWGFCKGNIGIGLFDEQNRRVQFCNVFGTFRSPGYKYGKSPSRMLDAVESVISGARIGYHYRLVYTVGGGGGHWLRVKGLRCVIYPEGCKMDVFAVTPNDCTVEMAPTADEEGPNTDAAIALNRQKKCCVTQ